jgi:hypothetical protein
MSEQTPLRDALKKLETDPTQSAELGVVAYDRGGAGLAGSVSTTLGKGWSLNAEGKWQHRTGWTVAAVARWTKGR